eukprot:TRINITY_DN873_c0_g7_i1.p1 TRINITY_DN873_c0_g7~~TRINITY_DN873_c0_g7_i1.p1  ORF type:complete len:340 (+),score=63.95 TRINITY_DN873_c0_g7_i1:80-1021(+)
MPAQITSSLLEHAGAISAVEAAAVSRHGGKGSGGLLLFVRNGENVQPLDVDPLSTVGDVLREAAATGVLLPGDQLLLGDEVISGDGPIADTGVSNECTLTVLSVSAAPTDLLHSSRIETEVEDSGRLVCTVTNDAGCCLQLVGPPVLPGTRRRWVVVMASKPASNGYFVGITSADEDVFAQRCEDEALERTLGTSFHRGARVVAGSEEDRRAPGVMLPDNSMPLQGKSFEADGTAGAAAMYHTGDVIAITKEADNTVVFDVYQKRAEDVERIVAGAAEPNHSCRAQLEGVDEQPLYLALVLFNSASRYIVHRG